MAVAAAPGVEAHAARLEGLAPQAEAVAAGLEGIEEMSLSAGRRGKAPSSPFASVAPPLGHLEAALAEAEAEWRQFQDPGRRSGVAGAKLLPALCGGEGKDEEAGAAQLHAVFAGGPGAAESNEATALQSRVERSPGRFCFGRDWQVTGLRAAAAGAGVDEAAEGCIAAAERRGRLRGSPDSKASAHFYTALRGERKALRGHPGQDVRVGDSPIRQQMERVEMEVLASSCEGAAENEEFDLVQSTALKLAQDRELSATNVTKQEEEMMRLRAEPNKMLHQEERGASDGSDLAAAEGRRSSREGEALDAAYSEQAEGHVPGIGVQRRTPCFERDWLIRELPEVAKQLSQGRAADMSEGRNDVLRSVLTKPPTRPSQNEVQALQQWLVAVNAEVGTTAPGADHDLAMARQTVERHADEVVRPGSPLAECALGELADPEGLRAQLVAATGGLPVAALTSAAA